MELEINPNVSVLDQVKLQTQVLLPVLEALRAELGKERADRLALGALRAWLSEGFQSLGARIPGTPREKYDALWAMGVSRVQENDLEIVTHKQEPDVQEFDVTRCRYAEFFRQLGEPELGAVLLCETDLYVAQEGSPEVELERAQTIMEGAPCCDFRIHIKRGQDPE